MSKITTIVDNIITKVNEHTTVANSHINLSGITAYHLLQGNLSVSNEVITNGFGLYLYTGNTTTLPSINLGMDITSQWGNTADETYGYLIKIKSRSAIGDWTWINSVRGITKYISSNTTAVEGTDANMFTLSTVAGVTTLNIGTSTRTNTKGVTYVVEVYQTTHRKTGVTNQGKTFTEHYNPDTGFTINGYEGSGLAGHEIQHSLGRKLAFYTVKNLSVVSNWPESISLLSDGNYMYLNLTDVNANSQTFEVKYNTSITFRSSDVESNASGNQYIMFGYRNSYFDESGKLIGNFEIGVYQGTANTNGLNKVTTRGKLAYDMVKRLDVANGWYVFDNQRDATNPNQAYLLPNGSNAEAVTTTFGVNILTDSFTCNDNNDAINASGGQYLYFGVYDNDNGSGKSKYPKATDTANVQINNGIIPLAHGIDSNGSKNSIVVANETITGLTYTEGKNYLYKTDTGYGVKPYEPRYLASELVRKFAGEQPDYYDVESNKWFNCDAGNELVTNGTFSSGTTTGWTAYSSVISIVNNTLQIIPNASVEGGAYTTITTVIGKKYSLIGSIIQDASSYARIKIGTTAGNDNIAITAAGANKHTLSFIAQSTITYVSVNVGGGNQQNTKVDDISVFASVITQTTEITESRNYLNHIVHADADGGVLYVEELPKIEYKNVIKAEEYLGKNACTGWVNFDGTTTPPTIRDSYNVSAVIRIGAGQYEVYFKEDMNNNKYSSVATQGYQGSIDIPSKYINKVYIVTRNAAFSAVNDPNVSLHINGGKN